MAPKEIPISVIIHSFLKYYGEIFGLGLLGLILWTGLFGSFYFWKEFVITFYKHKEAPTEGYITVLQNMRRQILRVGIFTLLMVFSLFLVSNIKESREKIVLPGWIIVVSTYIIYNTYRFLCIIYFYYLVL